MPDPCEMVRLIRVFVSSPGDVAEERRVMEEVVERINRTDGVWMNRRLELFRWETGIVPQIGPEPQEVVDSQTPLQYDIYIGIMKHRFGTPTGTYGSGTEKEFHDAIKRWGKFGKPWILFYFEKQKAHLDELDLKQYEKVEAFRQSIQNKGLYATYEGVRGAREAFFEQVEIHLRQVLHFLPSTGLEVVPTEQSRKRRDWADAPSVEGFVGRRHELATLTQWAISDQCRLIAIVGMAGIGKTNLSIKLGNGGIGKTDLSLKLAQGIEHNFENIAWRRLTPPPPIQDFLAELILFLSEQKSISLPETLNDRISLVLHYLRKHRNLLIIDNIETVLGASEDAGQYQREYEGYGLLFEKLGEIEHQSCTILTTREKPNNLIRLAGRSKSVRFLELKGLTFQEGLKVFEAIGEFKGSNDEWIKIVQIYDGNPLALELAAHHILVVFDGDISRFLSEGKPIFRDIKCLLDWHFEKLSELEKEVMNWLAINQEPISLEELRNDISSLSAKEDLSLTLESLQRHIPLEKFHSKLTLQPVLMEYMLQRLVEDIFQEIMANNIKLFDKHCILKASAKDYIRRSQAKLICDALRRRLLDFYGNERDLQLQLNKILTAIKKGHPRMSGYAAGNILNLLIYMNIDLNGYDFSYLKIDQGYFPNAKLQHVDLSSSHLSRCVFATNFGSILSLSFDAIHKYLALGDAYGQIYVWDIYLGNIISSFVKHTDGITSLAFSPKGDLLISCSYDKNIYIWDVRNWEYISSLKGHDDQVRAISFSHNGNMLASVSNDQIIKIWDINTFKCIHTLKGHDGEIRTVAFSSDERIFATGSNDCTIKVWELNSLQCTQTLRGHTGPITSILFSPDGRLFSSCDDGTIKIWDIQNQQCLRTLEGHTGKIWSIAFSRDCVAFASGGYDQTVRIWDTKTWECLHVLQGHEGWIWAVAFSPDGLMLASGSEDQTIKIWSWDKRKYHLQRTIQGHIGGIRSLCFSSDGSLLASACHDKFIRIWDFEIGKCLHKLTGHKMAVRTLSFSPDGSLLASGGDDQCVMLWDTENYKPIHKYEKETAPVRALVFSSTGKILATGSDDRVKIWDIDKEKCLYTLHTRSKGLWSIAYNLTGDIFACAGDDINNAYAISMWETSSWTRIGVLKGHHAGVRTISFSPDGNMLASGSNDSTIKIWDTLTHQCVATLEGHHGGIWSVSYSGDGRFIISGSYDRSIRIWDTHTYKCLNALKKHTNWVRALAFSPTNLFFASSGEDEIIYLWDIENGKCLKSLSDRPYEGMHIGSTKGLTEAQIASLKSLGAVEDSAGRR